MRVDRQKVQQPDLLETFMQGIVRALVCYCARTLPQMSSNKPESNEGSPMEFPSCEHAIKLPHRAYTQDKTQCRPREAVSGMRRPGCRWEGIAKTKNAAIASAQARRNLFLDKKRYALETCGSPSSLEVVRSPRQTRTWGQRRCPYSMSSANLRASLLDVISLEI